jgi:hypothetical protein
MLRRSMFGLALVAVLAAPSTASAQAKQNFSIVNKTGYTISEVYVSPAKAKSWQEDILGSDVLANAATIEISFSRRERSCLWDLKVVYDDGESAEWDNFNLCQVSRITISYNRKSGETWAEYD